MEERNEDGLLHGSCPQRHRPGHHPASYLLSKVSRLQGSYPEEWDAKDQTALPLIWSTMSKGLTHLVLGKTSGSEAWKALQTKYESSTWSRRVTLRTAFHRVKHDPSKPIDHYVQKVMELKSQLEALGESISDNYVKDILLSNLDPAYASVRNSLLSQPSGESNLDTVKSVVLSATYIALETSGNVDIAANDILNGMGALSISEQERAFLARGSRGGYGRKGQGPGTSRSGGSKTYTRSTSPTIVEDEKGYRWCDPSNENCCHRCGRSGHIAARCVYDMPPDIKDWVLGRPASSGKEKAHMAYNTDSGDECSNLAFHCFSPRANVVEFTA